MPTPADPNWINRHFAGAPPSPAAEPWKPRPDPASWPKWLALLVIAAGLVVTGMWASGYWDDPKQPAIVEAASLRPRIPARTVPPSTPPEPQPARQAAPVAKPAYGPVDQNARLFAFHVNEERDLRAIHLRWLDDCQRKCLVDLARKRVAQTSGEAQRLALVSANNLAADIDTHQREAKRIDDLLGYSEARLVKYCTDQRVSLPPVDNPPTAADPSRSNPRPTLVLP